MDIFSNLQVADECLLDEKRTNFFVNAIKSVVKPGDRVLDCGTGTGILALAAAESGASEVIAVEIAPDLAKLASRNFLVNGFKNITLKNEDVTKIKFTQPFNVIIAEMLDVGMIAEQQSYAFNNFIEQGIITEETTILPSKIQTFIELVDYDFNFYGFQMPLIVQARNSGVKSRIKERVTNIHRIEEISFNTFIDNNHKSSNIVTANKDGKINSVLIRSKIFLHNNIHLWETSDMNMPVIIPLEKPLTVKKGDKLTVLIEFQRGHGFDSVKIKTQLHT